MTSSLKEELYFILIIVISISSSFSCSSSSSSSFYPLHMWEQCIGCVLKRLLDSSFLTSQMLRSSQWQGGVMVLNSVILWRTVVMDAYLLYSTHAPSMLGSMTHHFDFSKFDNGSIGYWSRGLDVGEETFCLMRAIDCAETLSISLDCRNAACRAESKQTERRKCFSIWMSFDALGLDP